MEILLNYFYSIYTKKNALNAGIMLDAPTIVLCPKLFRHNERNPSGDETIHARNDLIARVSDSCTYTVSSWIDPY